MNQVFTLAGKDIKLMLRDKSGFFFTFFFPIIIAVLFGSIFGSGGGGTQAITVLAVDEDSTEQSEAFLTLLDEGSEVNLVRTDRATAMENVRRGRNIAFIALKEGFGESSEQMFWGDPPEVEIGVDPSRRAEAAMLQGILMKYGSRRYQEMFSNPGRMMDNLTNARESLNQDTTIDESWRSNINQLFGDLDRFFEEEDSLIADATADSAGGTIADSIASAETQNIMQPLVISQTDVTRISTGPRNAFAITFPQGIIWGDYRGCSSIWNLHCG